MYNRNEVHRIHLCKYPGCYNIPLWYRTRQLTYCEEHRDAVHNENFRRDKYFTLGQKKKIYARADGICWFCGAPVKWEDAEFHHIHQVAKSHDNSYKNGALLHKRCHKMNYSRLHDVSINSFHLIPYRIQDERYCRLLKYSAEKYPYEGKEVHEFSARLAQYFPNGNIPTKRPDLPSGGDPRSSDPDYYYDEADWSFDYTEYDDMIDPKTGQWMSVRERRKLLGDRRSSS